MTDDLAQRIADVIDRRRAGLVTKATYLPRHWSTTLLLDPTNHAAHRARALLQARIDERARERAGNALLGSGYYSHLHPRPQHGERNTGFDLTDAAEMLDGLKPKPLPYRRPLPAPRPGFLPSNADMGGALAG